MTSNLGLKNVGPLLFVYKGFLAIFFCFTNIFITVNKIPNKVFFTKKKTFLLNVNLKKYCEAKKMQKGAEKSFSLKK